MVVSGGRLAPQDQKQKSYSNGIKAAAAAAALVCGGFTGLWHHLHVAALLSNELYKFVLFLKNVILFIFLLRQAVM